MRIDMHAHYVPPRILEVLERDAAPYGDLNGFFEDDLVRRRST